MNEPFAETAQSLHIENKSTDLHQLKANIQRSLIVRSNWSYVISLLDRK